jgi:glucose-6-phosphate isomerase
MSGQQVGSSSTRRASPIVSPSQAWAILSRHARDEIAPLRLPELCRDTDRVSALVAVHNSSSVASSDTEKNNDLNRFLIVDLSRQLLTEATLNYLMNLASAMDLSRFIRRISWAPNNSDQPVKPISSGKEQDRSYRMDQTKMKKEHYKINATFSNDVMDSLHSKNSPSSTNTSMHMALRVPNGKGYAMYDVSTGKNVLEVIHAEWNRIEVFSDSMRLGRHTGATGHMMRDVLVIGRGVAVAALQFIYDALSRDEAAVMASRMGLSFAKNDSIATSSGVGRMRVLGQIAEALNPPSIPPNSTPGVGRRMKFLQSYDPIEVSSVLSELDPNNTLVISIAVSETDDMAFTTPLVHQWLTQRLSKNINDGGKAIDSLLAKHMMLVTGNERIACLSANYTPDSLYMLPNHARCPPFTTCTAATLLPLSVVFGWSICQEFLSGAHNVDLHFSSVNPRHNLPVLLALTDIWNERIRNGSARAIVPFSNACRSFPEFAMELEAEVARGSEPRDEPRTSRGTFVALDGGSGRVLFNGDSLQLNGMFLTEFIVAMDCQAGFHTGRSPFRLEDFHAAQDAMFCSCFAHADELAFGPIDTENDTDGDISPRSQESFPFHGEGNRPSTIILCSKMDAFTCGQFIALLEHRAAVKAYILGQDPFLVHNDIGASSTSLTRRTEMLYDKLKRFDFASLEPSETIDDTEVKDDSPSTFLSTDTLLGHYCSLMINERRYTVDGKQSTK